MKEDLSIENIKLLFGIKIKSYRTDLKLSLQDLSKKTGMAVSYLSEIESGKKYPKPEKMIRLAEGLNVSYDTLVSTRTDKSLDPFVELINSDLIRRFPFYLFGITPSDIVGLFKNNAAHANAFLQTFLQISRVYDLSLEDFLFAALRTYLRQHQNYFPELESKAGKFSHRHGLDRKKPEYKVLKSLLEKKYGYTVDETTLADHPQLSDFRSVFKKEKALAVNSRLMPNQKAFILARELGFLDLDIKERPISSSWIKVRNFNELVNNFKASYFGGALLMDAQDLARDMKALFKRKTWCSETFSGLLEKYNVTPEMLLYRFSQLLPGVLGIERIFYFRFTHAQDLGAVMLTKELNMTRTLLIYGLGIKEHYCRRMIPMQFLNRLRRERTEILSGAQIIEFVEQNDRFLLLSMGRPLALSDKRGAAIAVGVQLDNKSESLIRFIHDPQIISTQVSETCERCPLTDCKERVIAAGIISRKKRIDKMETALEKMMP